MPRLDVGTRYHLIRLDHQLSWILPHLSKNTTSSILPRRLQRMYSSGVFVLVFLPWLNRPLDLEELAFAKRLSVVP
jgi:hypothetical protein